MVPQSWQREKVNRLKIKIFLIGHIYEVKIISINKIFVFGLMVFSFYHLLGHHIRFHLVKITLSSDLYCDLQHISKV